MRIACLDLHAAGRLALQTLFDDSFEHCRSTIGHISSFEPFPCTKDEALLNSAPGAFSVGSSYSLEDAYTLCRELRSAHPHTPILLFVEPTEYSLRTLRRFQQLTYEVFSVDETPIRIVHALSSILASQETQASGSLVLVHGVKGGVGATSVVSGLAHAAEALAKKAVVVDLSANGVFSLYMGVQRWVSSDHAVAIHDRIAPDRRLVEKCLTTAPNGITVLLPPSGGTEIRERWLRQEDTFEVGLGIIEQLQSMFDVVLVDCANAEGILPFALRCRANARILVTSNDPASVHLLGTSVADYVECPGEGTLHVLVNHIFERGLDQDDVLDFLHCHKLFKPSMATMEPLPFDPRGRNWIGTGNSFYTESSKAVQQRLEDALATALLPLDEILARGHGQGSLFSGILKLRRRKATSRETVHPIRKALPFFPTSTTSEARVVLHPMEATPVSPNKCTRIDMEEAPMYQSPVEQQN